MAMGRICLVVLLALALCLNVSLASKKLKICDKGWECKGVYCCNQTISEIFTVDNFEELFSKRNTPVAHAVGFWDYYSFINAAAQFEGIGFGTTGGQLMQQKELAAFLGNVAAETSYLIYRWLQCCYWWSIAWGLCYKEEMSPNQLYCDDHNYLFPCAPGASYHGRGALPIYWNFNYGPIGEALKLDLLNYPDMVSNNATIGFLTAMWRWMNPIKPKQPSAHDVFVGNWKPTKNDTQSYRLPGFGMVINVLNGGLECGQGDIDAMNNRISHYLYFLDLLGVGRDKAGDNLDCGEQVPLNPVSTSATSR